MTSPQECVEFTALDVRIARVKKTRSSGVDWWFTLKPGFQYLGRCANKDCASHGEMAPFVGWELCHRGMGTFRPNEDTDYGKIRCPACQTVFTAFAFCFYQCSARIRFCMTGQEAKMFQLSQSTRDEYLELGEAGKMATYTSLIIDCQEIGEYEEQNMPTICSDQPSFTPTFGSGRCASVAG